MVLTRELRRRLARVVLFAGLASIGMHVFRTLPREVAVELRYGKAREGLRGASFSYAQGDLVARTATFRYADGAPELQRHEVRLRPGAYTLVVRLDYADRTADVRRSFESSADEVVRIDLR